MAPSVVIPMRVGIAAAALALVLGASGCGGSQNANVRILGLPEPVGETWPARTPWPLEAYTVEEVLASADGTQVRLVAYLLAIKVPCPVCNVGGPVASREEVTGRTSRPRGPAAPGCLPCPDPAATLGDESPRSPYAQGSTRPRLRAVGAASGLQSRHVGRSFFFVGVFHATGPNGPELEVTDVRALDGP